MNTIIFDKIKIHNFLSIGDAEVDLSDKGFVLVKGINKEAETVQSNGSGKSTLFDSLFWALTGVTLRGTTEVINEYRKSDGCSCELEFHTDDNQYKIIRNKGKNNSCLFYENGELLADQTKKAQELIQKAIPVMSTEILGSIVLLGQGLPYKFSALTPIKRKDLLETMSGSSSEVNKVKYKLDIEENSYHQQKNELTTKINQDSGQITGLEYSINTLTEQINSTLSIQEINDQIKSIDDEVKKYSDQIESYTNEKAKKLEKKTRLIESIEPLKNFLTELQVKQQIITNELSSIKSGNCPTCGRPYEVTEESINKLQELHTRKDEIKNQIKLVEEKFHSRQNEIDEIINTNLFTLENTIANLKLKINQLNRDKENISKKMTNIDSLNQKLKEAQTTIDALRVKINFNEKEVNKIDEYLDCINYLKRQLSKDFKGYLLKEVVDFLSDRSEYYGNYLFENKKIEVFLSGNNILITVNGRSYGNLSGGERQRVDLAVQFALRDMLVTTTGFACNILVLDEAFDNLDAQGAEALTQLIASEFSDVSSIYIVTHHTDINIPYDEQLVVIKNANGISSINGEI